MKFYTPPANQGQIVEVSYLAKGGRVVRRTTDKSDRTTEYHVAEMLAGDDGDYWNAAPQNEEWEPLSEGALEQILED